MNVTLKLNQGLPLIFNNDFLHFVFGGDEIVSFTLCPQRCYKYLSLHLKAAGLFKYVWYVSGYQALNYQALIFLIATFSI